jgi:hypothetical protein
MAGWPKGGGKRSFLQTRRESVHFHCFRNAGIVIFPPPDHLTDEDLSVGIPKPQKQRRGEDGAPSF